MATSISFFIKLALDSPSRKLAASIALPTDHFWQARSNQTTVPRQDRADFPHDAARKCKTMANQLHQAVVQLTLHVGGAEGV